VNKLVTIKRYKYVPFDIGSLKIITQGTIKFTRPSEFNDPFDCDPGHDSEKIEEYLETRPDLVEKVANFLNLSRDQIREEKPHMVARLRDAIKNGSFGQPASDNVGICCLTKDPLNLLMWAHYADNHKGFVVEFDIPIESYDKPESEVEFFELLIPHEVNYNQKKPIVKFDDSLETKLEKQFLTKGKDWEYEQEERVVDYIRKAGIHPYKREIILNSVIAGTRMEDSNYDLLDTILHRLNEEHDLKVNLYRASQVPNEFELYVEGRPDLQPCNKNKKQ
jgi:hypothetical protein